MLRDPNKRAVYDRYAGRSSRWRRRLPPRRSLGSAQIFMRDLGDSVDWWSEIFSPVEAGDVDRPAHRLRHQAADADDARRSCDGSGEDRYGSPPRAVHRAKGAVRSRAARPRPVPPAVEAARFAVRSARSSARSLASPLLNCSGEGRISVSCKKCRGEGARAERSRSRSRFQPESRRASHDDARGGNVGPRGGPRGDIWWCSRSMRIRASSAGRISTARCSYLSQLAWVPTSKYRWWRQRDAARSPGSRAEGIQSARTRFAAINSSSDGRSARPAPALDVRCVSEEETLIRRLGEMQTVPRTAKGFCSKVKESLGA